MHEAEKFFGLCFIIAVFRSKFTFAPRVLDHFKINKERRTGRKWTYTNDGCKLMALL